MKHCFLCYGPAGEMLHHGRPICLDCYVGPTSSYRLRFAMQPHGKHDVCAKHDTDPGWDDRVKAYEEGRDMGEPL